MGEDDWKTLTGPTIKINIKIIILIILINYLKKKIIAFGKKLVFFYLSCVNDRPKLSWIQVHSHFIYLKEALMCTMPVKQGKQDKLLSLRSCKISNHNCWLFY